MSALFIDSFIGSIAAFCLFSDSWTVFPFVSLDSLTRVLLNRSFNSTSCASTLLFRGDKTFRGEVGYENGYNWANVVDDDTGTHEGLKQFWTFRFE